MLHRARLSLCDPYLDFTAVEAGTYFVGVSGADNNNYSALSLGDRRGPASRGEYTIEIDVKAPRDWIITPADSVRQFNGSTITISDVNNTETYQLIDRINPILLSDPTFIPIIYDSTPVPNGGARGPGYRPPEMTAIITQTIAANTALDIVVTPFGGFRTATPGGPEDPLGNNDFPTSTDFFPQGFSHDTPFTDVVSKLELNVFIEGASNVVIAYPPGTTLNPLLAEPLALTSETDNRDQFMAETGILVSKEASPTMLNNVLINLESGIIQAGSPTAVVGGSLYQHNLSLDTNVNPIADDFSITLGGFDPLFVNPAAGVFLPSPGSRSIDSAIDSLEDRAGFASVKAAAGIPVSPILAPDRDAGGQLRVDDPDVAPPLGQGANVF